MLPFSASAASDSAARRSSICYVISGSAGAPSGVENLIPWYSGGLCDAVKLIAPHAFLFIIACEMVGVGVGRSHFSTLNPFDSAISDATSANRSPMNLESWPTIIN